MSIGYQKYEEIMAFDIDENRQIEEHSHRNVEILYVLEGSMALFIGRSRFELQKEDLVVINTGKPHSYRTDTDSLIGVLSIDYFRLMNYLNVEDCFFRCNSVIDKNKVYGEMKGILEKIFHLYFERDKEKAYLNSLYYALLHILLTNFCFEKEPEERQGISEDEKRIQDITRYIHTYYQYPISLNDMAAQLHFTTSYLSKYIKSNLGMNFMNYLTQVRLESAVEELKKTGKSITRIALDNGFPNTAAFSNAFRKEYDCLPSEWQKNRQEESKERDNILKIRHKEKSIQQFLEKMPEKPRLVDSGREAVVLSDAEKSTNYVKCWNRMINVGSVYSLLHSELQEQIKLLHQELGFTYVRFWDVFSDDMLMNYRKSEGKLNFKRINMVFDFLVNHGMHPFIELGFKPVNLLTRTVDQNVVLRERNAALLPMKDYEEALRELLVHCVNRYGLHEVEQWYFEQWCDPRVVQKGDFYSYFSIFEQAYYIVKGISPEIRIGGAGFGRLYTTLDFKDIISLWKERPCYPDFISMYSYPYMARSSSGPQNNDRIQDPNFVVNQVLMMREILNETSMHIPELMLTEWSSSVSDWNILNDSMYKGAFILKTIIDNIGLVDMMGYWLASDLLTEYYDTGKLLHGGNGLLSSDGIKKPAFYAIQFAGKLFDRMLARTEQAVVTANGHGNYYIACHNYVHPNFKYYLKSENEIDVRKQFLIFDTTDPLKLHFTISNVKNGRYAVKIYSLNADNGSVQDEWKRMNLAENLSQRDIQYMREISTPRISMLECMVQNSVLEIDTVLEPQEIQNIHILYQLE